jgi:diadenosine tetraphosphatase ApaH/serine/threonine PP2A family protein phosphatase
MRIGLISDIHANLEALEAALAVFDREPVDYLACLGDVVGYGAQPNECCELVRTRADVTILGNHDAAVCGRMDYSYYRAAARHALDVHARQLSAENLEWLRSLPYAETVGDVTLCHGSPVALQEFEYVFLLDQVRELRAHFDELAPVTFIGHSHLCKCFSFDRDGAEEVLNTRFQTEPGRRYIITVGSVGQPRDYDNRACCAVYDTEARWFEYHRVPYDVEAAARKILAADLDAAFGKRLFLGV